VQDVATVVVGKVEPVSYSRPLYESGQEECSFFQVRNNHSLKFIDSTIDSSQPSVSVRCVIGICETGVFDEILEVRVGHRTPTLEVSFKT